MNKRADSIEPVEPGEIVKYEIQILATANEFKAGHRICVDGAMSHVEYIPYHIGISKSVTHKVYRDAEHPSHLLLPIILKRSEESVGR